MTASHIYVCGLINSFLLNRGRMPESANELSEFQPLSQGQATIAKNEIKKAKEEELHRISLEKEKQYWAENAKNNDKKREEFRALCASTPCEYIELPAIEGWGWKSIFSNAFDNHDWTEAEGKGVLIRGRQYHFLEVCALIQKWREIEADNEARKAKDEANKKEEAEHRAKIKAMRERVGSCYYKVLEQLICWEDDNKKRIWTVFGGSRYCAASNYSEWIVGALEKLGPCDITFGNNAPRGGAHGNYIIATKKSKPALVEKN